MVEAVREEMTDEGQEADEVQEAKVFSLELLTMEVPVIGVSPYLAHRFSPEVQAAIEAAQQGAHRVKKPPRNPEREFELSQYRLTDGRHGLPAVQFKRALIGAVRYVDGLSMTAAEGMIHVVGNRLPFVHHTPPVMQSDRVVIARGTTSIAYRARYDEWEVVVPVKFLSSITPTQLVNLFEIAGFTQGVGDWRPSCKGTFGMFEVKKD